MLSYAQNAEDVVLRRAFSEFDHGFYVDAGAGDPVEDSVTLYFYERGWSGVNIEPDPHDYERLKAARPRDININVAVGADEDRVTFYQAATRGHGTLDRDLAAERGDAVAIDVQQIPLRRVLADYSPAAGVDFLKVDVEGWEAQVIGSTDWREIRPRVVLVEAVDPDGRPTHEPWEGILLAANYRLALFDGLNRFYCREEDAEELLPRLAAPPNVLDNWRDVREVRIQDALQTRASEIEREKEELRSALADERAAYASAISTERAAGSRTLSADRAAHAAALQEVFASTSWRVTTPLRDLSRVIRLLRSGSST